MKFETYYEYQDRREAELAQAKKDLDYTVIQSEYIAYISEKFKELLDSQA